jgi:hypothetical protein
VSPKKGEPKPDEAGCSCLPPFGDLGNEPLGYTPIPVVKVEEVFKSPVKEGKLKDQEIVLSKKTEAILKSKESGCFLCRLILEDHAKNAKLTGYPADSFGKGMFPVESKVRHIELEKLGK